MDVIIPACSGSWPPRGAKGIPIVYTTTAYAVTEGPNTDMGLWHKKIPIEVLRSGAMRWRSTSGSPRRRASR